MVEQGEANASEGADRRETGMPEASEPRTMAPAPAAHRGAEAMSLTALAGTSAVIGVATGTVTSAFRAALEGGSALRDAFLAFCTGLGPAAILLPMGACALLAWIAALMVSHFEPASEGSGIPRVEAVVRNGADPSRMRLLPVKFAGGVLAISSGLALGREGPSVHMGGNIAHTLGKSLHRSDSDLRLLIAAGAAAGLASAFSAPLAGAVFVLEELVRRFEARMTVAVLVASSSAYVMVHLLFGPAVMFPVELPPAPTWHLVLSSALVGGVCGIVAVGYNRSLLGLIALVDRTGVRAPARAALIGACVGAIGFFAPELVGGGDNLTAAAIAGQGALGAVLGVFAIRFIMAIVSYTAGTPGGIFAPMLVLGSHLGLLIALLMAGMPWLGPFIPDPSILAIMGMSAFFAASVRAPVTGLVLAIEMTGSLAMAPALLGACAVAVFVAEICKVDPIYDALAKRSAGAGPSPGHTR